jgi:hypothetical protein
LNKEFCNYKCHKKFQLDKFIAKWKNGEEQKSVNVSGYIRRYLFAKHNNSCSECGWSKINQHTGKIPLEIDHVDGNYKNNIEENLRLICPSCHSLTPTYKGANKGGRDRRKYKSRY